MKKNSIPIEDSTITSIALIIAIFVFVKNCWITEDAYILFRCIEQLFAGHGPIWNPHERVQVFTSPLWLGILSITRFFSKDLYLNTIFISFVLWILTLFNFKKLLSNSLSFLVTVLFCVSSTALYDFTSSGLENVLGYFLVSTFLILYFDVNLHNNGTNTKKIPPHDCQAKHKHQKLKTILSNSKQNQIIALMVISGMTVCTRLDYATLFFLPTIYIAAKNVKTFSIKQWVVIFALSGLPFLGWTLFSILYYGFPFPNTAYAKLDTGIDHSLILQQGIKYFFESFRNDSITLLPIAAVISLMFSRRVSRYIKPLILGILLNLFYIVYVGGDFMQGRFLSYAYLFSVLIIVFINKQNKRIIYLLLFAIALYLSAYPHTPLNSPFDYTYKKIFNGVADERGHYFKETSLYSYISKKPKKLFPNHPWSYQGVEFQHADKKVESFGNIGIFGYYTGVNKIIIDPTALSDPLLSRLPVPGRWRIGHFLRKIPDGYLETLATGRNLIKDPYIKKYYNKLKIITQSEKLFDLRRLKTIFLFNIGSYKNLLVKSKNLSLHSVKKKGCGGS